MVGAASWALWVYLAAQRLWELASARRNDRLIRAVGGKEHASGHYPLMVAFHMLFFLILAISLALGARLGIGRLPWLAVFIIAQALRFWAVRSLGPAWSTRIWTVPGRPWVRTGPYRFLRHPIYGAVVLEMFSVPLAYGLVWEAALFSAVNAALLAVRIPSEERALAG